jgi:hypothetical protein
MKKHKLIAPFLMLFAGAVAYLCMLLFGYEFRYSVLILFLVLVVFYLIGSLIQNKINMFVDENEEKLREEAEAEGAVIEKEAPPEEEEDRGGLPPLTGAGAFPPTEESRSEETEIPAEDTDNEEP